MICGHGSRDVNAVEEFDAVARGLRERLPQYQVESGFLEFATPIIRDGLDKLHAARHDLVLAVPGMLFAAGHAKNDIPSVLRTYEAGHPGMEIRYARELGIDPRCSRRREIAFGTRWTGHGTTCRCTTPCWWWWGAARPTPTPTPTSTR